MASDIDREKSVDLAITQIERQFWQMVNNEIRGGVKYVY